MALLNGGGGACRLHLQPQPWSTLRGGGSGARRLYHCHHAAMSVSYGGSRCGGGDHHPRAVESV
jgi:hypothetical protein